MNRCALQALAIVASLKCGVIACGPTQLEPPSEKPNVILITIDTLRADRVGVYGGEAGLTPTMDALAERGVTFLDATAHAPLTLRLSL